MAKQDNTGITLSEARGPLTNLLINLSGDNGVAWLTSLKKMLRGSKPEPPVEAQQMMEKLYTKDLAKEKVQGWVALLMAIPAVNEIHVIQDEDDDDDIMNIMVHQSVASFLHCKKGTKQDTALFVYKSDGRVDQIGGSDINDPTFTTWSKDEYDSIVVFAKALIELGDMYNKYIPEPVL